MRLRDVEVGEDVAVEPRLDVFGDGRAQGDEKHVRGSSQAADAHSSDTVVLGSGEEARRRCNSCLRNADTSDAALSRTSVYPPG